MANLFTGEMRVYVGGFNPGSSTTTARVSLDAEPLDQTSIEDAAERVIGGVRQDRIEWAGWFDDAAGGIDKIIGTLIGTTGVVVSVLIGTTTGARAYAGTALMVSGKPGGNVRELARVEAEWRPDGSLAPGRHFGPVQVKIDGTVTGSIDNAALTTGGGVLYTHVTEFSGTNTYRVVLEDSADGTTFADIATADHTGTIGKRTTLTGTVRRYTRVTTTWASTGGGTATGTAAFVASVSRS